MIIPAIGGTQLGLLPHDGRTRAVHTSEEYDVYAGRGRGVTMLSVAPYLDMIDLRPGWLGNPHEVGQPCSVCLEPADPRTPWDTSPRDAVWHPAGEALRLFERDFLRCLEEHPRFRRAVLALKGKRLGCPGCPTGEPCHARIIAAWVDAQEARASDAA